MGENGSRTHPRGAGSNKPTSSGISQDEVRQLRSRLERVERILKEHYAEKNQWNSLVREWVGSPVVVWFDKDHNLEGKLLWVDRYTLCIEAVPPSTPQSCIPGAPDRTKLRPIVVHKGLVAFMHQR